MSILAVAREATSAGAARVPGEIVSREILWKGPIIEVTVPKDSTMGTYPDGKELVPFLRFAHRVTGGFVNCFVHTNKPALCGATFSAEVCIMKKVFADGRSFVHVDYLPTPKPKPATHQLMVVSGKGYKRNDGWRLFETPAPVDATVVLAPLGAKTDELQQKIAPVNKKLETKAVAQGRSLKDLQAQGWKIDKDDGKKVLLYAAVDGKRRELVFERESKRT